MEINNKFNFAHRIISDYLKELCKNIVEGKAEKQSAHVLELLSQKLITLNETRNNFKNAFENKAMEYINSKFLPEGILLGFISASKSNYWMYHSKAIYINPNPSTDKELIILIPAFYHANKETQKRLKLSEKLSLRQIGSKLNNTTFSIQELYKIMDENDHLFFLNRNLAASAVDTSYCWLDLNFDYNSGKILVNPSRNTKYKEKLNLSVNDCFDKYFKEKEVLTRDYDELANYIIDLAGDIAKEDINSILKKVA